MNRILTFLARLSMAFGVFAVVAFMLAISAANDSPRADLTETYDRVAAEMAKRESINRPDDTDGSSQ